MRERTCQPQASRPAHTLHQPESQEDRFLTDSASRASEENQGSTCLFLGWEPLPE